MASIPRLAAGSNEEQVECRDELITEILSRVSTRDLLKMSTVRKRWRSLIFDPSFAHTHYKNCDRESMFCLIDIPVRRSMPDTYQFRSYNSQTGFSLAEDCAYTLVFDSQSNSWYKGSPLLRSIDIFSYDYVGEPLFFDGVIYFVCKVESSTDAQELKEIRDVDALFRDDQDRLYMIIGYDVNQDQWNFSIFIPASVGFPYCLTEWEGNLLVCASNSTHEENLFVLAASSTHDRNRRIRYSWDEGDGHFVFWILDTEHKLWTRERELDLSHQFHTSWRVSASGGLVWFTCGYNSVTVYHMKNRHWSTHRLDITASALRKRNLTSFVCFEPTLLAF
ncbi:uncharacterized protein LOC131044941 [Cryptomeria japonica]|uniref:uncharacterized protein LOC131044941 n=1 Tax=Cryptomeria japonica TaxID=3369 RepID=UPI0025AB9460|nr:uncharacterized protein LOC131044941 [Cryptomeria japonica]